jgi:hypothetical protein
VRGPRPQERREDLVRRAPARQHPPRADGVRAAGADERDRERCLDALVAGAAGRRGVGGDVDRSCARLADDGGNDLLGPPRADDEVSAELLVEGAQALGQVGAAIRAVRRQLGRVEDVERDDLGGGIGGGQVSDLIDTTEMYLRTIYELVEEGIVPLRARIAERLHQSGPTVSQTVARMERDGLLTVEGDRHLELTDHGRAWPPA